MQIYGGCWRSLSFSCFRFPTATSHTLVSYPYSSYFCLYRWPQFSVPPFKIIFSKCLKQIRIGEEISLVRLVDCHLEFDWGILFRDCVFLCLMVWHSCQLFGRKSEGSMADDNKGGSFAQFWTRIFSRWSHCCAYEYGNHLKALTGVSSHFLASVVLRNYRSLTWEYVLYDCILRPSNCTWSFNFVVNSKHLWLKGPNGDRPCDY